MALARRGLGPMIRTAPAAPSLLSLLVVTLEGVLAGLAESLPLSRQD